MPKRVPEPDTLSAGGGGDAGHAGLLYVEGPLDRDVIRGWCYRLGPPTLGALIDRSVILGGRQPERAVEHFAALHAERPDVRALCVLDRDDETAPDPPAPPQIEFFTWSRRHIESYLLVPAAIARCIRRRRGEDPLRTVRALCPDPQDEPALQRFDAKRLLARDGPLARVAGHPIRAGRIARELRRGEFHPDVEALFARLHILLETAGSAETPSRRGSGAPPRREGML